MESFTTDCDHGAHCEWPVHAINGANSSDAACHVALVRLDQVRLTGVAHV
jgi:hypothetical protein